MMAVKTLALALLAVAGCASLCGAGVLSPSPAASGLLVRVDWQPPLSLPPRFRNHCTIDNFSGRPYCENHCGSEYQFFYCSDASFGCCHLGRGYCDWNGHLRCAP
jgi:hypothetical protein